MTWRPRRPGRQPVPGSSRTAAVAAATTAPTAIRVICQPAMASAVSRGPRRGKGPAVIGITFTTRAGTRTVDAARAQVATARIAASPVQPHRGLPYTPGT